MIVLYNKHISFEVTVSRPIHPSKNFIISGRDPREDLHNSKTEVSLLFRTNHCNTSKNVKNTQVPKSIVETIVDIAGKNYISNFKYLEKYSCIQG